MTLVQLKHLISLAETGSFSKSAGLLFLTQPALSRSIRSLEQALGQPLFDRVGRHSELTPFGQEALARARELVQAADELRRAGQRLTCTPSRCAPCAGPSWCGAATRWAGAVAP